MLKSEIMSSWKVQLFYDYTDKGEKTLSRL